MTKALLASACAFLASYLMGSFVANSFDISYWSTEGRALTVYCGLVMAVAAYAVIAKFKEKQL